MLILVCPSGALFLLEAGMCFIDGYHDGIFWCAALSGTSIALQCVNFAYTLPVVLSTVATLQVGHATGAKNPLLAQRYCFSDFWYCTIKFSTYCDYFYFSFEFFSGYYFWKAMRVISMKFIN